MLLRITTSKGKLVRQKLPEYSFSIYEINFFNVSIADKIPSSGNTHVPGSLPEVSLCVKIIFVSFKLNHICVEWYFAD